MMIIICRAKTLEQCSNSTSTTKMTKTHSLAGSNALESVVNGANLISPAGSHTQIIASMSLIAMSNFIIKL